MQKKNKAERGVAMFMAIFALLLLTAMAAGLVFMANTETAINANYRSSQQAYFAARAGLEEARTQVSAGTIAKPTLMPNTSTAQVIYLLNPTGSETIAPWDTSSPYFDVTLCKGNYTGLGLGTPVGGVDCAAAAPSGTAWKTTATSVAPGTGTATALGYKWVRVAIKANKSAFPYYVADPASADNNTPVCWDGAKEILKPAAYTSCEVPNVASLPKYNTVFQLTDLAIVNGARIVMQTETARSSIPLPPAAILLAGPTPFFDTPHSNAMTASGNDAAGTTCPGGSYNAATSVPAIGTVTNADDTAVSNALFRPNLFSGAPGTTPAVDNVSSNMGGYGSVAGLNAITEAIRNAATPGNTYGTPGVPYTGSPAISGYGTTASPQVTVINGNASLGAIDGAGILLVTGNLTLSGNPNWTGVIFVVGKGTVVKSGGGNGVIRGALIVAKTVDSSGNPLSTPGSPSMDWQGGGTADLCYDSAAVSNTLTSFPQQLLVTRQLN